MENALLQVLHCEFDFDDEGGEVPSFAELLKEQYADMPRTARVLQWERLPLSSADERRHWCHQKVRSLRQLEKHRQGSDEMVTPHEPDAIVDDQDHSEQQAIDMERTSPINHGIHEDLMLPLQPPELGNLALPELDAGMPQAGQTQPSSYSRAGHLRSSEGGRIDGRSNIEWNKYF